MCELFAMSSRFEADVCFSLEEFSRRGGLAGPHKDGWGIAYYADRDVRLVKEAEPASNSACARFMQEHPFSSALVIGHIRRATQGAVALRNCQPFVRELGGAMHVFAHNGDLASGALRASFRLGVHRPVGETDSEYAFCALLERLRAFSSNVGSTPPLEERLRIVSRFATELRAFGPANFLYADGDALFAHGHKRMHGTEGIRPPGLHALTRRCTGLVKPLIAEGLSITSAGVTDDRVVQRVALFASVPLTVEPGWCALGEGEVLVVRRGEFFGLAAKPAHAPAERALRRPAAA